MKPRFYFDEDSVHRGLLRALEARGLDLTNAVDEGRTGIDDEEQLRHATEEGRVLFTFNVGDFHRLHADWSSRAESHAGIVIGKQSAFAVGPFMRAFLKLAATRSAEEMRGRLEFLSSWS